MDKAAFQVDTLQVGSIEQCRPHGEGRGVGGQWERGAGGHHRLQGGGQADITFC